MENSVENLKIIFQKKKEEIEKEILRFNENENIILMDLGLNIHKLTFKNKDLDQEILDMINKSINHSKQEFEKKWSDFLKSYGIYF